MQAQSRLLVEPSGHTANGLLVRERSTLLGRLKSLDDLLSHVQVVLDILKRCTSGRTSSSTRTSSLAVFMPNPQYDNSISPLHETTSGRPCLPAMRQPGHKTLKDIQFRITAKPICRHGAPMGTAQYVVSPLGHVPSLSFYPTVGCSWGQLTPGVRGR